LALCSGALGLLIALATTRLLVAFKPPLPVPLFARSRGRLAGASLHPALALATGVICGLAPAIQATKPDLVSVLKDDSTGLGRYVSQARPAQPTGGCRQVAVSTLLLIAPRSFSAAWPTPSRSIRDSACAVARSVDFSLGLGRKYSAENGRSFLRQLVERISALPA